jgi:predicted oxidoreductase
MSLTKSLGFSRLLYTVWRWQEDPEGFNLPIVRNKLQKAKDLGIHTFEYTERYGDGEVLRLLGEAIKQLRWPRDTYQLVVKTGLVPVGPAFPRARIRHYDHRASSLIESVNLTLKTLRTQHIDLLLLSYPDPLTPPHETAEALTNLYHTGKVRAVGTAFFNADSYALLQQCLSIPLLSNQLEISLWRPDAIWDGRVAQLQRLDRNPLIWQPLSGGQWHRGGRTTKAKSIRDALTRLAPAYDTTPDALAVAWLLAHPAAFFPVLGSNHTEYIHEATEALKLEIDRQDWFDLYSVAMERDLP